MPPLQVVSEFEPTGDQPQAIDKSGGGLSSEHARPGVAGRDRFRQDLHDGQGDRARAEAHADPRPQQDAGRATLQRDARVLSQQRGGVLRQLLRLLSAGSLHPAHRHIHRKGSADQRGDRPAAAGDNVVALQPARHSDRGFGLVHLWFGQPAGLRACGAEPACRRHGAAQPHPAPSGRDLLRAQRQYAAARALPCARRCAGGAAGGPRVRLSDQPVGATRSSASARSTR